MAVARECREPDARRKRYHAALGSVNDRRVALWHPRPPPEAGRTDPLTRARTGGPGRGYHAPGGRDAAGVAAASPESVNSGLSRDPTSLKGRLARLSRSVSAPPPALSGTRWFSRRRLHWWLVLSITGQFAIRRQPPVSTPQGPTPGRKSEPMRGPARTGASRCILPARTGGSPRSASGFVSPSFIYEPHVVHPANRLVQKQFDPLLTSLRLVLERAWEDFETTRLPRGTPGNSPLNANSFNEWFAAQAEIRRNNTRPFFDFLAEEASRAQMHSVEGPTRSRNRDRARSPCSHERRESLLQCGPRGLQAASGS